MFKLSVKGLCVLCEGQFRLKSIKKHSNITTALFFATLNILMSLFYNYELAEMIHSSVESMMLVKLVHIFNKICAPHTRPIPTHQQGVRPVLCCSSGMQDVPSEAAHTPPWLESGQGEELWAESSET